MTPEERITRLEANVADLEMRLKEYEYPATDRARAALATLSGRGAGSTTKTQTIALSGNAQNIDVPAAYVGTEVVDLGGYTREFPYIA